MISASFSILLASGAEASLHAPAAPVLVGLILIAAGLLNLAMHPQAVCGQMKCRVPAALAAAVCMAVVLLYEFVPGI